MLHEKRWCVAAMFHFNAFTVVSYQLRVSVLCFRNPKDTAVSLYNHHRDLVKFYNYNGEWKDWLPLFMQGKGIGFISTYNYMNIFLTKPTINF